MLWDMYTKERKFPYFRFKVKQNIYFIIIKKLKNIIIMCEDFFISWLPAFICCHDLQQKCLLKNHLILKLSNWNWRHHLLVIENPNNKNETVEKQYGCPLITKTEGLLKTIDHITHFVILSSILKNYVNLFCILD